MAPQFDRALRDLPRAAGCTFVRQGEGAMKSGTARLRNETLPYQLGFPAGTPLTPFSAKPACPRRFEYAGRVLPSTRDSSMQATRIDIMSRPKSPCVHRILGVQSRHQRTSRNDSDRGT